MTGTVLVFAVCLWLPAFRVLARRAKIPSAPSPQVVDSARAVDGVSGTSKSLDFGGMGN